MTANSNIITLTDKNFNVIVLKSSKLIIVEIGAVWCGTCHIMTPILEKVADHYKEKIEIGLLDITYNEDIAREYGVTELPFLLFFKNGELIDHIIGAVSTQVLKKRVKILLERTNEL